MDDARYLPAGVHRCSLFQFGLWLGLLGIIIVFGTWAAYWVFSQGLGVTQMNNSFGFGLWVTYDLAAIALGAGAFFSGFLYYILRIQALKNILHLAVIVGFVCYSGAMALLMLDIGQPLRAWFGYWHPNVHSMLTEVIFCISCYLLILIIECIPIILHNPRLSYSSFCQHLARNFHIHMPLFIAAGTFLSFFHQGSLGGVFGVLFGRPFVMREDFFIWPFSFFLFILSAVASGPVFIMLIASLMEKMTGRRLVDFQTKSLLGKISGFLLAIYVFFKILDTWAWAQGILPEMGLRFEDMYNGTYSQWLLWAELGLCGLLPALMLVVRPWRMRPFVLHLGAVLTCAGVILNRFAFTVHNLAVPVLPFEQWTTYIPNWTEWATTLCIIAYSALIISLAYRYLPLFPQEQDLN